MAGILQKAGAWLTAKMQQATAADSESIVYSRVSGGVTIDLTGIAWVGRTLFSRLPNEAGAAVVWGDRDYLIPVADLVQSGTAFEPERGDRLAHTVNGITVTFEVAAPGAEPAWRYSDQERETYRVHTKEVEPE